MLPVGVSFSFTPGLEPDGDVPPNHKEPFQRH